MALTSFSGKPGSRSCTRANSSLMNGGISGRMLNIWESFMNTEPNSVTSPRITPPTTTFAGLGGLIIPARRSVSLLISSGDINDSAQEGNAPSLPPATAIFTSLVGARIGCRSLYGPDRVMLLVTGSLVQISSKGARMNRYLAVMKPSSRNLHATRNTL